MQSQPVNLGDLLQQIRRVCGAQQFQIVIGGPQAVSVAGVSDKVSVSGSNKVGANNKPRSTSDLAYSYRVKIVNPNKKSDVSVFYLNDFTTTFDSVTSLRVKLHLKIEFLVHSTSMLVITKGANKPKFGLLHPMIWKLSIKSFLVVVKSHYGVTDEVEVSRKRKRDESSSETGSSVAHRHENEQNVQETYKKLLAKHTEAWDTPRLTDYVRD